MKFLFNPVRSRLLSGEKEKGEGLRRGDGKNHTPGLMF